MISKYWTSLGYPVNPIYYNEYQDGDTISVHFNDTSLMVIITMTGQY